MVEVEVDLHSDTQTRPSPGMREAMAEAPVGDEQRGEDPSVNRLCEMAAELTGKEAAVFMPSGTMCNQASILVHCRPGDEIIADKTSHIINSESGGAAALAGAQIRAIDGKRGIFTAEQAEAAVSSVKRNIPRTRMIEIEQTSNAGGGSVWPLETIREVAEVAKRHDLIMHMDGARMLNAAVASNVTAADFAEPFDSLWIDLSKGLGCPVGAVLCGSADFIEQAWSWKQRLGGAMRQSGIVAAAGVYALENNVDRLADDHALATKFADGLSGVDGIDLWPVETNLVFFSVERTGLDANDFHEKLLERGVRIGVKNRQEMRAVTHLDVSSDQVARAAEAVAEVAAAA
ncbi:MAG TPA: low specificity L-threonine aldolase [Rhodospirillaceae bacterium]|nr:low specificity L-threonine aldolase [Rhodospirillaceae bacterium]HAA93095.1 low specificity L-threonine aldolase [Rhodospirillaceae bacterium]HAT36025.1 low specificity L-threonine aldolase [Rhodospirillaceae bacterium]